LELFHQYKEQFQNDPYLIAVLYHNVHFNQVDYGRAKSIYEELTDQGHSDAMNGLAYIYRRGQGIEQDFKKAIEFYEKSINLGNSSAMNGLAHMYTYEYAAKVDEYHRVIKLYEQAIKLENSNAMSNLAYMYQHAQGVERDYKKAIQLYKQAVKLGNSDVMNHLAWMYENGKYGVKVDLCRSLNLYLQGKHEDNAQNLIDNCKNFELKSLLYVVCLKYDFNVEYKILGSVLLRESWLYNIVVGILPHQKHPLFNRHIALVIVNFI
jgi:TPR repeat protein